MSIEAVTSNSNLPALLRLYDTLETYIRGLQSLRIPQSSYGALLSPVLLTKLPQETRLILSCKVANDQWELGPILEALLAEIEAREKAGVVSQSAHSHTARHKRSSVQELRSRLEQILFLVAIVRATMSLTLVP